MAIAKIIEVKAEGNSIEDAVEAVLDGTSDTVRNIKNVYVKDIQAVINDGSVSKYRINAKVTFVVDESK